MPGVPRDPWFATLAGHFYLSVQLFFVISAFSLYHSSRYAPARYPAYLVKRFFRIAPLYYVMLGYVVWRIGFPGWGEFLANATFTFNLFPGLEQGMVFAGWSVGVEMIFYLMLPGTAFPAAQPDRVRAAVRRRHDHERRAVALHRRSHRRCRKILPITR